MHGSRSHRISLRETGHLAADSHNRARAVDTKNDRIRVLEETHFLLLPVDGVKSGSEDLYEELPGPRGMNAARFDMILAEWS